MANIATGLLGRFIPKNANLTEDERSAIARQGLLSLGAGLLGSQSGGNFGAALSDGIRGGLLSMNRGVDDASDRAYKRALAEQAATGGAAGREWEMITQGFSAEEKAKAARIKAGLDPRAVTAAAKIEDVVGIDGYARKGIFDPTTRQYSVYDGTEWVPAAGYQPVGSSPTGAPPTPQPSQPPPQFQRQATAPEGDAVAQMFKSAYDTAAARGLDDEAASAEAAAAVQQALQSGAPPQPRRPAANPGLFMGRPKEQEAGAVTSAQESAKLAYLAPTLQMQTDAAIATAGGSAAAKGAVETNLARENDAFKRAKDAAESIAALDAAESILRAGRATGSGLGASSDKAAAFFGTSTVGAQDAARLKPLASVLLQKVPRFEGPQSDKDVASYREAAGSLSDDTLPRATRLAAAAEIRRLNQKYLRPQGGGNAAPAGAPRRLKFNPATGKLE